MVQGNIIGTGSIRKNEICRLFILPEYQGKGYGSKLMDLLETRILENYPRVHVDASFPAESMYLKRGIKLFRMKRLKRKMEISSAIILWKKRCAGIFLYWKLGFQVLREQNEDYLMVLELQE